MSKPIPKTFTVSMFDGTKEEVLKKLFNHLAEETDKAYEAGKRDALPVWPPKDGYYENQKLVNGFTAKAYRYGITQVHFCGGKWSGVWGVLGEDVQVQLTAAYFMGELEEVEE